MRESTVQRDCRLFLGSKPDLIGWRNNVGRVFDERTQNWIQYGLCPGSSDFIGIASVQLVNFTGTIGRFYAAEFKGSGGRLDPKQRLFIDLVNKAGGYASSVRSVEDAEIAYRQAMNVR